jgi:putative ABC transport system substrate-binding protein
VKRRALLGFIGGTAATGATAARAQPKAMPVIGFLALGSAGPNTPFTAAFVRGLNDGGYEAGKTVAIEFRWAEGHYDRLPALAAELVDRKVDVIVAQGGSSPTIAAKKATATIPIVFITGGDPLADGLVTSLARPSGNVTGITWISSALGAKRLELLRELAPRAGTFALLVNPGAVETEPVVKNLQEGAEASGVKLHVVKAGSEAEIEAAFAAVAQAKDGGLVVGVDAFFGSRRRQIAALAERHALPVMAGFREFATDGGLMSYGPSLSDAFRQGGLYAAKILKGAKPGDLPVLQPTIFELVINTKVAKALGLAVSPSLLSRADEVIE